MLFSLVIAIWAAFDNNAAINAERARRGLNPLDANGMVTRNLDPTGLDAARRATPVSGQAAGLHVPIVLASIKAITVESALAVHFG